MYTDDTPYEFYLIIFISCLLSLVGIVIVVIKVLKERKQNNFVQMILNLSISDFIFCIDMVPFLFAKLIVDPDFAIGR